MSVLLDDELGIPKDATLPAAVAAAAVALTPSLARLETATGTTTIALSRASCQRPAARCLVVGRQAAACDIRIQHGSISRKHAVLYFLPNNTNKTANLMVMDLGGKHGTHVHGKQLTANTPVRLKDGDSILFGNVRESTFTVKLPDMNSTDRQPETNPANETTTTSTTTTTDAEQQQVKDQQTVIQEAGAGLSGRAKRQAEIAAMMASLDQTPVYEKYTVVESAVTAVDAPTDTARTVSESSSSRKPSSQLQQTALTHKLPVTQIYAIPSESKRHTVATCLAIDPAGSRFAVGHSDMTLNMYDFGGMDQQRTGPFKSVIPDDGHVLVDVCYSNTGDRLLVGTGSVQPTVLNRDGDQVIQFLRGDMYVTDQSKTVGHTAAVTAVDWHPLERDVVLTGSRDGSARLWNLNGKTQFDMLVCDKVFSAKNARGQRAVVTAVVFHPAGREFAVGTACGSIQIWNLSRVSGRPERAVYDAHGGGGGVGNQMIDSLTYNMDGSKLASRSSDDDTCKIWNARRLSRSSVPVQMCAGLPTVHEKSNASFSADGHFLCAGSSESRQVQGRRVETGSVKLFAVPSSDVGADAPVEALLSLPVDGNAGPVVVKWHPKLNQIIAGCSDGRTLIYYDPELSSKGVLLAKGRVGRRVDDLADLLKSKASQTSHAVTGEIITPFSQHGGAGSKRRRDEPVKSLEPERPVTGKHKSGQQAGGNLNFQQFIADKTMSKTKIIAGQDPREALFEYSEGKSYISQAYKGNKETILADKTAEEEEDEQKKSK